MGSGDTVATCWSLGSVAQAKAKIINGLKWLKTHLPENTNRVILDGASVDSIHPITENRTMAGT